MNKALVLIDLSNLFWASWHSTADQALGTAYEKTVSGVRRWAEQYDYVAVCCDGPPYWRKELLPAYKANRDAHPELALEQLRRVEKRLEADGLLLWKCRGYEADDVIATACRLGAGIDIMIASSDKDLNQLVSDARGIQQTSLATGVVYDEAEVRRKHGVGPDKMLDFLALCGDKSDNVPGIPGVGPKNAAKLLADFGTALGVLAGCDKIPTDKLRESVFASGDAVRLGLKLIELKTDAPINFEDIYAEREIRPLEETDMEEPMPNQPEPPSAPEVEAEPVNGRAEAYREVEAEPVNGRAEAYREALAAAPPVAEPPPQKTAALAKTNGEALATSPSTSFDGGLQPGTLGAAWKLAQGIYNSRLYQRLPNAEAIWAIIIRGREMGLGALTALDSIAIVEGRPAPGAHLLVARAKQHPDCEYFQFLGGDDTYAEWETKNKRNPKPTRLKYTIEQARKAGLIKPRSNWETRPAEMIRKTSAVQLARLEYPESLLGAYSQEELEVGT